MAIRIHKLVEVLASLHRKAFIRHKSRILKKRVRVPQYLDLDLVQESEV